MNLRGIVIFTSKSIAMKSYIFLPALFVVVFTAQVYEDDSFVSFDASVDDVEDTLHSLVKKEIEERGKPSSCTSAYEALGSDHTMCKYHDSSSATNKGVSAADKTAILAAHNKLRSKVAEDTKQPAAAMQKIYWDDEMAKVAQKWAQVCSEDPAHDHNKKVPGYGMSIGQNVAKGKIMTSWNKAIQMWYDEVKDFKYGTTTDADLAKVGHFTQVVRDVSGRLGCGYAKCGGHPNYVCNYGLGNLKSTIPKPYKAGSKSCSDCGSKCSSNLCDCNGKICKNGGKMNVGTCTCACKGVWSGSDCGTKSCPPKDKSFCNKKPFVAGACKGFKNVPEDCPHMCGVC